MQLSRTWTARLDRSRVAWRRAGIAVSAALAVIGGAAGVKVFVLADRPNFEAVTQAVGNDRAQVGAFASEFVVAWLTATTSCSRGEAVAPQGECRDGDGTVLTRFVTLLEAQRPRLPVTPAAVVTSPQVVSVLDTGAAGDAELYAVVVAVDERPYASASAVRAFYRVPVTLWHYQTRAVSLPARINGPGPGADVALGYRQALDTASPVYAVLSGFIKTYLCSTTGLDRYVVAGTALTAIGGYQTAVVTSAATAEPIPDNPRPGTQIHVLSTVVAQTPQFATVTMTYPVTIENSDGTWMVAGIDPVPKVEGEAERVVGGG